MVDQSELNSRALRCAGSWRSAEPANRTFWMGEAENWSRLSQEEILVVMTS